MLKIVYGKKVEQDYPIPGSGFRNRKIYRWEELFSIEKEGVSEHEIIFSLNPNGEDETGKVLEIWKNGKKIWDHEKFDFDRTHGLESLDELYTMDHPIHHDWI